MTSFFVFSLFYRSVTLQRYVIANQCAHWCGNPFLAMRSIASAVGRSRWVYKSQFIIPDSLVGQIILIVWYCQDSTGDNQWGPNPKY